MEWPNKIEAAVWRTLEPAIARRLNVVPIAAENGLVTFVYGEQNISRQELDRLNAALSFAVKCDVNVVPLGAFEESVESEFKEFMHKRYEIEETTLIFDSIANDAMTVLLLSRRPSLFKKVETSLFGIETSSLHTPQILEIRSLEKALDIAATKGGIGKILIAHDAGQTMPIEEVVAKFQSVSNAKLIVLLEGTQTAEWLNVPDNVECICLESTNELAAAIAS